MKLVAATNNAHKVQEIKEIFGGMHDIMCIADIADNFDPLETGADFSENALIKARAAYALTGLPCFADDSGLCIDHLGGKPGIYSARYAEPGKRKATVLEQLSGVPAEKRTAYFTCVFAYCDGQTEFLAEGKCLGRILETLEGDGGFGYDPIFFSDDLGKSFGNASSAEKNEISHRARAARQFLKKLEEMNL